MAVDLVPIVKEVVDILHHGGEVKPCIWACEDQIFLRSVEMFILGRNQL